MTGYLLVALVFATTLASCQNIQLSSNGEHEKVLSNYELTEQIDSMQKELQKQKETTEAQRGIIEQQGKMIEMLLHGMRVQEDTTDTLFQYIGKDKTAEQANMPYNADKLKRADDLGPEVSQIAQQLNVVTAEIHALKNADSLHEEALAAQGTTYIRWGNANCPNSASTVYSGFIGGSWYDDPGAAANHLCLSHDPVMDSHSSGTSCASTGLHGAEYDTCPESSHDLDPVCAVCRIPRSSSVMIAGTNRCWAGWTLEYAGYLMAGYYRNGGASEFICVDQSRGYRE